MSRFLSFCFIIIILSSNENINSYIGQYPSVVPGLDGKSVFGLYNAAQGLGTIFCHDTKCDNPIKRLSGCNIELISTSMMNTSYIHWNTSIHYIGVYSARSAESASYSINYIVCFDQYCDSNYSNEITHSEDITGYTTAISYYNSSHNSILPMFAYTVFNAATKAFEINLIFCGNILCQYYIGKNSYSKSPLPVLNLYNQTDTDDITGPVIAKGQIGLARIPWKQTNSKSGPVSGIMVTYTKYWRIPVNNDTVYFPYLTISVGNITGGRFQWINHTRFNQMSNYPISLKMVPSVQANPTNPHPIAYAIAYSNGTSLFIKNCVVPPINYGYNICTQPQDSNVTISNVNGTTFQSISNVQLGISIDGSHAIAFIANSSYIFILKCKDKNCTNSDLLTIQNNSEFTTSSMQLSLTMLSTEPFETALMYSITTINESYSGLGYYYCGYPNCYYNTANHTIDVESNFSDLNKNFELTPFIITLSSHTLITLIWIYIIFYKINPKDFISRNIQNAFLNTVTLDVRILRPNSYWIFWCEIVCSSICVVPWFAYFQRSKGYIIMILPPFVPILISLIYVIGLYFCMKQMKYILIILPFFYYLANCFLSGMSHPF